MRGHPLTYPLCTTIGALAICLAWAPFGDSEQVVMLVTVAAIIVLYSVFRLVVAFGPVRRTSGEIPAARVRQQHRLLSRSWLELETAGGRRWLPVYFDPALVTLPRATAEFSGRRIEVSRQGEVDDVAAAGGSSAGEYPAGRLRMYPSGPLRNSEPPGRLIDNPSRPDPDGPEHAAAAARPHRRLLLDAQSAVAAPILGLLWVATAGGGIPAFAGATTVAAAAAVWFTAIRGSDPS